MNFKTRLSFLGVKVSFWVLFMCLSVATQAQVTIGSGEAPEEFSTLQIDGQDGGLRLPVLDAAAKTALEAKLGTNPKSAGLMIYNKSASQVEYWDGTKWLAGKVPSEPWRVSGGTNEATANTQDIYQLGKVTIGNNAAAVPSAALNVDAADKGVLLPRIALKSAVDDETIPNPAQGLLVYNTGTNTAFPTVGYMFWDGEKWKLFASASSEAAEAVLHCTGAQMSPSQQILNGTKIISGTVLQIPYSSGNGGSFNGLTLTSEGNPNVKATIADGLLAVGNGVLSFSLSGTPTLSQQAPTGIAFDLSPFLSANADISGCDRVVVGNILTASIEQMAVMGNLMLIPPSGNDNTTYYAMVCNTPDGKFSIRVGVPSGQTSIGDGNQYLNIQIRNNTNASIPVIWNFSTDYDGALCRTGVLNVPPNEWGGDNESGVTWYKANDGSSNNGNYWGQIGIYDAWGIGPEYRRYTWIPSGENSKVAYEVTVMAAIDSTVAGDVHPTKIKCFMKMEQVTAM